MGSSEGWVNIRQNLPSDHRVIYVRLLSLNRFRFGLASGLQLAKIHRSEIVQQINFPNMVNLQVNRVLFSDDLKPDGREQSEKQSCLISAKKYHEQ